MSLFTAATHEYWCTVSGNDITDIALQVNQLSDWGVAAIEYRSDLMPASVYEGVLSSRPPKRPTFVAHFGVGKHASTAFADLERASNTWIDGLICHSRSEILQDVSALARACGKRFGIAFHSQEPLIYEEIRDELERQNAVQPFFRKIAFRASKETDALALIRAVSESSIRPDVPVIGAIFGRHRWARIALANVGSAVSFIVSRRVTNEVGGDDEQLQISQVDALIADGLLPTK